MFSKQEIENKRLAALEKIRAKNSSQLNNSFGHSQCFESANHNKHKGGVGPLHQNNGRNPKFQPYSRNSTVGISSTPPSLPASPPIHKVVSGTIYLITEDRFEVKPSDFSEQMINIFKTIPSRSYGISYYFQL